MRGPAASPPCEACGAPLGPTSDGLFVCPECHAARPEHEGRALGPYRLGRASPADPRVHAAACVVTGARCVVEEIPREDRWQDLFAVAEASRALRRSGLIDVLALRRPDDSGDGWIATAYRPGRSFQDLLGQRARLDPVTAAALVAEIAAALAALHAAGFGFGWLTPGDITLTPAPVLGLPRLPIVCSGPPWSLSERVVGNPYYAAPELLTTDSLDLRSDTYTLGLFLWQLVAGPPFAPSLAGLREKLAPLPAARSRRPECPAWLDAAIARAVAVDPSARHPSMDHFRAALAPGP